MASERLDRVTGAVRMMLISVDNRIDPMGLGVDQDEERRRAEMVEHGAVDARVGLYREADSHKILLVHNHPAELPD